MKLNKSTLALVAVFTAAVMLWTAGTDVSAQGRYVGQYSKGDVDNIIKRLEDAGDEFRTDFRRELDRSNLSSSQKNTYRRQVDTFENSTDRLRSNFNNQNNWWNSRSQVQTVVANSRPLNVTMNSIGFRRNIERQWNQLRNNVNTLADTYDLSGIAGGGWSGGGDWGSGGQTINPPSWARGTFYGTAPDGNQITLTIANNGSVTANIGGNMSYGRFTRGNNLFINGATSRVTRQGNGVRTTSNTDRQVINYSRTGWGGGGGNPGTSRPPSWAVGTFNGRAPNGTSITLTIGSNGRVTSNVGGSMNYGSYNNGLITINESSSRVTQVRNGIRTTSTFDGQVINYRRN